MKRVREEEWMDGPNVPPEELAKALDYIRWINRILRYNVATRSRVEAWSTSWTSGQPITILDVATGSADVPADLLQWNANRWPVHIIGLDFHGTTIREATKQCTAKGFAALQGDAMHLPFADASIDYVMTSMFLHHLSEEQTLTVLREMWRVARRGVLAADLLRSRRALAGVWALTRLSSKMIRHDATVSVKQAYTIPEITTMTRAAGWSNPDVKQHRNYRFTAVASKV